MIFRLVLVIIVQLNRLRGESIYVDQSVVSAQMYGRCTSIAVYVSGHDFFGKVVAESGVGFGGWGSACEVGGAIAGG